MHVISLLHIGLAMQNIYFMTVQCRVCRSGIYWWG